VVALGNVNAITDGASGAALAQAALTSAGLNVKVNTSDLKDRSLATKMLSDLQSFEDRAVKLHEKVDLALKERGGFSTE
jgi:formiminotetrahydrofolate cyclodeaminase